MLSFDDSQRSQITEGLPQLRPEDDRHVLRDDGGTGQERVVLAQRPQTAGRRRHDGGRAHLGSPPGRSVFGQGLVDSARAAKRVAGARSSASRSTTSPIPTGPGTRPHCRTSRRPATRRPTNWPTRSRTPRRRCSRCVAIWSLRPGAANNCSRICAAERPDRGRHPWFRCDAEAIRARRLDGWLNRWRSLAVAAPLHVDGSNLIFECHDTSSGTPGCDRPVPAPPAPIGNAEFELIQAGRHWTLGSLGVVGPDLSAATDLRLPICGCRSAAAGRRRNRCGRTAAHRSRPPERRADRSVAALTRTSQAVA